MAIPRFLVPSLALMLLGACAASSTDETEMHEARLLMGTMVEITVSDAERLSARAAVNAAYADMGRLSDMMNHYDPASVVSAINRQAGRRAITVPTELMAVLKMAHSLAATTQGAFDVTVGALQGWRFDPERPAVPDPGRLRAQRSLVDYRDLRLDEQAGTAFLRRAGMRIDLGGIAKLYILHVGMETLRRHGVRRAMINAGGDVEVMGGEQRPWRIGIRDPHAPSALWGVIELAHGFVVSSGDYERYFLRDGRRYHHILDPRTGYPSTGLRHVTLVGQRLQQINGVSAAVMVLGFTEGRRLVQARRLHAILITDQETWVSAGLRVSR